jgi:predicted nucleotidyltransferase component of viral defense system
MSEVNIISEINTMLPLKQRLHQAQKIKQVNWEVVELDYTLSWVLAAIGQEKEIRENLIFKGGTCLKKCYFGDKYRYSQDLDFTAMNGSISDQKLDEYISRVVAIATKLASESDNRIDFTIEFYKERQPHPFNQKAYTLRAQLPWQRTPLTKIKLEISRDEKVVSLPNKVPILHEYGEKLPQELFVYTLEEILAEKYRAILQNQERLKERQWIRSRVRDFYDLWCILTKFNHLLKSDTFHEIFKEKCNRKNIEFNSVEQFFNNQEYLTKIQKDWGEFLAVLVADLPDFNNLILQLEQLTGQLFGPKK